MSIIIGVLLDLLFGCLFLIWNSCIYITRKVWLFSQISFFWEFLFTKKLSSLSKEQLESLKSFKKLVPRNTIKGKIVLYTIRLTEDRNK